MGSSAATIRAYARPAIFSFGFRPFFLGGAIVAAVIPLATVAAMTGFGVVSAGEALTYHQHEMIFGYVAAAMAGFLLTAIPNWTGRLPIAGTGLGALVLLWLAGRAAFAASDVLSPVWRAALDAPFLCVLAFVVWREVIKGHYWRNGSVAVILSLFCSLNLVWHWMIASGAASPQLAVRGAIAVIAMLVALIGGRITPSFTRNWLARRGDVTVTANPGLIDKAALAVTALALFSWAAAPMSTATGFMTILASVLTIVRLSAWKGWKTLAEPLVAILHIGYLWLPVALFLIGLSAFDRIPAAASLHALTAGLFGVMTLAVMTRATRGHTGRSLSADGWTTAIFVLANMGALARVASAIGGWNGQFLLLVAAALWSGAFALFCIVYGRYLVAPRPA